MTLTPEVLTYIEDHRQEAFDLLLTLARIPSPSNHEEQRAQFCRDWLLAQGAGEVRLDEALNVILPLGDTGSNPLTLFTAHTDVVFPDTEPLPLRIEGNLIRCPGAGDDTANLVAMLMAAKYILERGLTPREEGILLVADSGEEGLGNLKGCRRLMADYGHRVKEFVSLDAWNEKISPCCVGSLRYRVEVRTEGGHSYEKFGSPNAIHILSRLVTDLYLVPVPTRGKTTYNVGIMEGGTSVNTIPQQASLLYEIRSDHRDDLEEVNRQFFALVEDFRREGFDLTVTPIGERPCMGDVEPAAQQALVDRAVRAVRTHFGREPLLAPASTDCNIPLSMGIPSVTLGCFRGKGFHTREEYVEIDSLLPGLKVAFEMILDKF